MQRLLTADIILNGGEMWITNSPIADVAIVWAKLDGANEKPIRGFLVERGFEGFSTLKIRHKMSLAHRGRAKIVLEDCFVPKAIFCQAYKVLRDRSVVSHKHDMASHGAHSEPARML